MNISIFLSTSSRAVLRRLACCMIALLSLPVHGAVTDLADSPLNGKSAVPGNLAITASVEYPTASTPAFPSTSAYSTGALYLGYFDSDKCYAYVVGTPITTSYFTPFSIDITHSHTCTNKWSGHYLNWASTQSIDAFRWALTGGKRVVDDATTDSTHGTILEKTYFAALGASYAPDKTLPIGFSTGATPFSWANNTRIAAMNTTMLITSTGDLSGAVTDYSNQASPVAGTVYRLYMRVKVCDSTVLPSVTLESNCVQYGANNYKPEGLLQKYAMKLRYSIFGYLNDSDGYRDGGVLRARMKYIGPMQPVPGSSNITNPNAEWDSTTGVMIINPDPLDATATTTASTVAGYTVAIPNSGVMNYLNKFGKAGAYKTYDPVSELYYAAHRYFRNKGNVASYSSLSGAGSTANMTTWLDDFPVISTWADPILYSCQQNFILGIGDVNTHKDENLPGSSLNSYEPAVPPEVTADTLLSTNPASAGVTVATNMVGQLEGISSLATYSSGRNNSMYIAGLAYDAHTNDIRADLTGKQSIETYWLDVMEGQVYKTKNQNQYYLAAKYGGFTVPSGFDPYAASNTTTTLADSTWYTTTDLTPSPAQKRPDNYYLANQADKMVNSLKTAFADIAQKANAVTTSFSSASSQVGKGTDNMSYSSDFSGTNNIWSGEVLGKTVTYAADGTPSYADAWNAGTNLTARITPRQIITCCTTQTAISTSTTGSGGLEFETANIVGISPSTNYSTNFANVPNATSQSAANYLAYLRGNTTKEVRLGGAYKNRNSLLGDIVDSKITPVSAPELQLLDSFNPGYNAFKLSYKNRAKVIYVGANDGMMHAFDGTAAGGSELFAYIPGLIYGSIANIGDINSTHQNYVNATPQSYDIDMTATGGPTPSTAGTANWKSVLIGGLGKGGKGYYAIDITNPASWTSETALAGKVLWEFTDSRMGYSYGDPVVVKTKKYGWVVIFCSGYNNADGIGYVFIVNPSNGRLLETISTGVGSAGTPSGLAYPSAFINDYGNFTSDAVYAGDLLGNLWRVDLTPASGAYPITKIATLKDPGGASQPITTRPTIATQPDSFKRYVLIGTGRLLGLSDMTNAQQQAFYAIVDGTASAFYTSSTLPSGVSFPIRRSDLGVNSDTLTGVTSAMPMGWYFDLQIVGAVGQRINTPPDTTFGLIAFSANWPTGTTCSPTGTSDVFALNFATGKSVLTDNTGALISRKTTTDGLATDVKFFSVDGHLRLIAGTTGGSVTNMTGTFTSSQKVMGMNWRGMPSGD